MRKITTHKPNKDNRQPELFAGHKVSPGNAPQKYRITYDEATVVPGIVDEVELDINFISVESDGVTNETLLAVVIDRLEGFQDGPFSCAENETALQYSKLALHTLHERTRERNSRGVENKHEK